MLLKEYDNKFFEFISKCRIIITVNILFERYIFNIISALTTVYTFELHFPARNKAHLRSKHDQ